MSTPRAPRPRSSQVAKAARAGESSRKVWLIAAVLVVVGFAGVMAVALSQEQSSGSGSGSEVGDVELLGAPLPLHGASDPDEAIGSPIPELSGRSLTGDAVTIAGDGRPKLIGVFAHWCQFCQAEVPEVSAWYNAGGLPEGVDLYAISTDLRPNQGNYPPSRWFEGVDWTVPTLLDDSAGTARAALGLSAYPYWVAVAADGTVVERRSGQLGAAAIEGMIELARNAGS